MCFLISVLLSCSLSRYLIYRVILAPLSRSLPCNYEAITFIIILLLFIINIIITSSLISLSPHYTFIIKIIITSLSLHHYVRLPPFHYFPSESTKPLLALCKLLFLNSLCSSSCSCSFNSLSQPSRSRFSTQVGNTFSTFSLFLSFLRFLFFFFFFLLVGLRSMEF